MISFFNSGQLKGFVKAIIFLLWFLICTGTQVLSRDISPYSFSLEECEPDVCSALCSKNGFSLVSYGQPVPVMLHLCTLDDICHCSTLRDDDLKYAWTRGRAIKKYICELSLPAEKGKTYEYQRCHIECTNFGYQQRIIDRSDETVPDTDLIFNLVQDDDCCCAGKPELTNTWHTLGGEGDSESEEYEDLGPASESSEELINSDDKHSGDIISDSEDDQSSEDDHQSEDDRDDHQSEPEPKDPTRWYPDKRMYEDESYNPWRESSEQAAKRVKWNHAPNNGP